MDDGHPGVVADHPGVDDGHTGVVTDHPGVDEGHNKSLNGPLKVVTSHTKSNSADGHPGVVYDGHPGVVDDGHPGVFTDHPRPQQSRMVDGCTGGIFNLRFMQAVQPLYDLHMGTEVRVRVKVRVRVN